MQIYSKHIFLPQQEVEGYLTIENGKIVGILDHADGSECHNHPDDYIMPGYIDLHVHGWATGSFWLEHNADSLYEMQKNLPKAGVTSFLGTSSADDTNTLLESIEAANVVYANQHAGAELLGMHMEGPFINPKYKGMQKEENCVLPNLKVMQKFYDAQQDKHLIKLMTVAPEQTGAKELLEFLHEKNITVNIGHSSANFADIQAMKPYGLHGVTHMFSGMKGMHHRELGVAGTAMYDPDLFCEFAKQTGMTVRHEAFDLVYRLKGSDRIYLTTDCVGYAKVRNPFYHYVRGETFSNEDGKLKVEKDNGEVYYLDPLNYDDVCEIELSYEKSVMNMAKHSAVTPFDVMKMTASNPAKYVHVYDRKGSLEMGKDADINICTKDYQIIKTFCRGELMEK